MRAVNLLPEKHRPRKATGGRSGSAYGVLGILGAVLVGLLVYVFTVNSINGAKTDIAEARAETARANAQAQALGGYGDFAKIKQQREDSVKQLAQGRVDWERMVREVAHVLPEGVWVRSAEASATGDTEAAGSGSPDPAAAGIGSPTVTLVGCAVNQNQVADTLVRLRQLQGATDVKLDHSTQPDSDGAAGAGASSDGPCGTTSGTPNYEFQAQVTLAPNATGGSPDNVPARLGGGQ
jgi:Tfp pilus assembly protein PilN